MTRELERVGEPALVRTRYLVRGSIAPRFIDRHALSAEDAIAFVPDGAREQRQFATMVSDGSIRMPRAGRFYFDIDAYEAAAEARRRRMLPVLVIVPLLIALVAVLSYVGGR